MKGKIKTYILLIASIAIWGTIGYRLITGLNIDIPEVENTAKVLAFTPKKITETDTFSIKNIEKDPFLGTLISNKKIPSTLVKKVNRDTIRIPITYHGLIKKENSKEIVYVVTINGTQHLIRKAGKVDEITLVKGNAEEVLINYNNIRETITKQ